MKSEENKNGLTIRELLENTYESLAKRNPHQEIILNKPALSEIANDSDWHRTRIGYMRYEKANLFNFSNNDWAVCIGEKFGSYPAERFDSDLSALKLTIEGKKPEQIEEDIRNNFHRYDYFQNSLVFGFRYGNMGISKDSKLGEKMQELLKPKIENFIVQKAEYDETKILCSTLEYPVVKNVLYKPNFVGFLTETIETVLKEECKKAR